MWSIIREILIYLCFLTLIYLISYANMNSHSFYQVKHLRRYFLNTNRGGNDYTKVRFVFSFNVYDRNL